MVVLVDASLIQQYCPDRPDLYRFTKIGLEKLFDKGYELLESHVSIAGVGFGPLLPRSGMFWTKKQGVLRSFSIIDICFIIPTCVCQI